MAKTMSTWFDHLYRECVPSMQKIARNVLDSPEAAEDIVQEVFIILLAKQAEVRTYKNPKGWLYLTLRNQIGNYLQRSQYRKVVPLEDAHNVASTDTYQFSLSDSMPKGLKEHERLILQMFYDERLTYEEISERLGCTILTCRTRLCRARTHYKDLYLKEFEKRCSFL